MRISEKKTVIPDQYTDSEIIAQILEGDVALFELIVRRYNAYLYKIGRSYPFDHEDTQDLMQDTFVNVFGNLSKFEGRSSFKSWVIRIMLNNCYHKKERFSFQNELRMKLSDKSISAFAASGHCDTSRTIANNEMRTVIEKALTHIPQKYRMVFTLREMNGMSVSETSDLMDIAEGAVKVRLNRAKAMLRKEIEKSYSSEEIFEFNLRYCDAMVDRVMAEISAVQ